MRAAGRIAPLRSSRSSPISAVVAPPDIHAEFTATRTTANAAKAVHSVIEAAKVTVIAPDKPKVSSAKVNRARSTPGRETPALRAARKTVSVKDMVADMLLAEARPQPADVML
jgi:hypothetical protein